VKRDARCFLPTAAAIGLCIFGLFAHCGMSLVPLSALGLAVAAVAIGRDIAAANSPASLLGLAYTKHSTAAFVAVGLVVGGLLAVAYRWRLGWTPTGQVRPFALLAILIGSTEELVYRGYIQGQLAPLGPARAVVLASLAHALYKCTLFVFSPAGVRTGVVFLAVCTFLGGLLFGSLRHFSKSATPPVVAHAVFDLIAYGDRAQAPWWVWS